MGFLIGASEGCLDYRGAALVHHLPGKGGCLLAVLDTGDKARPVFRDTVTVECWPCGAGPARGGRQYQGWPRSVGFEELDGRVPLAWLPESHEGRRVPAESGLAGIPAERRGV